MDKIGSVNIKRRETLDPVPEHQPWTGVGQPKEDGMARPEIKMQALKSFLSNEGGRLTPEAEYTLHSEREAREHVEKGLGKRLSPESPVEGESIASTTAPPDGAWKLQLTPEEYLERFPNGPNVDQAKAEIERRKSGKGGEKADPKKPDL